MSDVPEESVEHPAPDTRRRFGVPDLLIAIVVAFFFAVGLFRASGDLVSLPPYLDALGLGASTPWVPLVAAVVLPVVIFAAAVVLGRGRPAFARALILIVALGANSAIAASLSTIGLALIQL